MICECLLSVLVGSYHSVNTDRYNAFNPGIIVERSDNVVFMAYLNSYKRLSAGGGYIVNLWHGSNESLNFIPAILTGYSSPVVPSFHYRQGNHNLHFTPPIIGRQFVIAYSYTIR